MGGMGGKGLKMCGQGRGELSNKSFSLKRITDDDGLRMGGRGALVVVYMTGFQKTNTT